MKKLIAIKHSKYEWERKTLNLSHDELIKKYNKERANLDAIMQGHDHQIMVREQVQSFMPNATFRMIDEINNTITGYDLVIVIGGDNATTKITHYTDDTPIIGVNSDPDRSVGHLTRWAMHDEYDVMDFIEMLDFHEYEIEEWQRLEATLNGKLITRATSEYYFGERMRNKMSRHVLVFDGKEYEQKCSGIVIATGCGSSGWYRSIRADNTTWEPTCNIAAFVVSEPYNPRRDGCYRGELAPGSEIILHSLNDDCGIASADSWDEFSFTRGTEARIYPGRPLNVLVPRIKDDTR